MLRFIAIALAVVASLLCNTAVADVGRAKVVTYHDDAIRSRLCEIERPPYYYAVDRTGYIKLTCRGEPSVFDYGQYRPPSAPGAVLLRVYRTDLGTTTTIGGCGLLMLDGEDDGQLFVALDCRSSAGAAWRRGH